MLTKWLVKTFVKRPEDTDDERVRYTYGRLAGAAGLTANVLLFAAKLAIGALSGSVAILADAFNNLSDAGSSIVTLVGFKLSSAPPRRGASLRPRPDGIPLRPGGGGLDHGRRLRIVPVRGG